MKQEKHFPNNLHMDNYSENEHFHCKECDCILTGYEVDICCWCDEDREEPDSCGETISYWEGFDYD